jgi:hypothetical protein
VDLCENAERKGLFVELTARDHQLYVLRLKNPRTKRVIGQTTVIQGDIELAARILSKKL